MRDSSRVRHFAVCFITLGFLTSTLSQARVTEHIFGEPGLPSRLPTSQTDRPRAHTEFDDATVLQGTLRESNPSFSRAIGKLGGCTATIVSPPNAEVTAIVFAAHCSGADEFLVNGTSVRGFQCFQNRHFAGRGSSSNDDVGVCFSRQRVNTGLHACLTPTTTQQTRAGDVLRIFGHGNPVFNGNPTRNLLSGLTQVLSVQPGGAIIASGEATVTPGDSGGPIIRADQENQNTSNGFFNMIGVNSKVIFSSPRQSSFAPFTPNNMDFFNRAITSYQGSNPTGEAPRICGLNYTPGQGNTPPQSPVPQPPTLNPPAQPPSDQPTPPTPPSNPLPQTPTPPTPPTPQRSNEEVPPINGTRYLIDGQWRNFIPLSPNVTAVNGHSVPAGDRPIGYRLRNNGSVDWVAQRQSPRPNGPNGNVPPADHGQTPGGPGSNPGTPRPESNPTPPTPPQPSNPTPNAPPTNPSITPPGIPPVIPPVAQPETNDLEFECIAVTGGFRPRTTRRDSAGRSYRPLGQGIMSTRNECQRAITNSKNGLVCSRTGLNGWKATHYSGRTNSRMDFGYIGGSSIMNFEDCLSSVTNSTADGICYWGGSSWFIGDIQGSGSSRGGSFSNLNSCIQRLTNQGPRPILPPRVPIPPTPLANPPNPSTPSPGAPPTNPSGTNNPHSGIAGRNCNQCHSSRGIPSVPEWALNRSELETRLSSTNATTRQEANRWADLLHTALVDGGGNMPPRSSDDTARNNVHSMPEIQSLRTFLGNRHSAGGGANAPRSSSTPRASNAVQVLPAQTLAQYRNMLPQIADSRIQSILQDPNTLFYDEQSLPPGYQDPSNPVVGVRGTNDPTLVRGAPFRDPISGKLKLFSHPAGTDPRTGTRSFHFLSLPRDANGNLQKIRVWRERARAPDDGMIWRWSFPIGTVSGEVIYQNDSSGRPHVLEVRTRTKDSENGPSQPDIFVAVPTKADLMTRLRELRTQNPSLAAEINRVEQQLATTPVTPITLNTGGFELPALQARGATSELPNMSEELTRQILNTPFRSSRGAVWDSNGTLSASAPTTRQPFGIVPQNSSRGAFGVDRTSCNRCHGQANISIRNLYPPGGSVHGTAAFNNSVYLYGNTPGNDNNLRFHPFDPRRFSQFGFSHIPDNRSVNPALSPILDVR